MQFSVYFTDYVAILVDFLSAVLPLINIFQARSYQYWTGDMGGSRWFKSGHFLYRKHEGGVKESNVSSSC